MVFGLNKNKNEFACCLQARSQCFIEICQLVLLFEFHIFMFPTSIWPCLSLILLQIMKLTCDNPLQSHCPCPTPHAQVQNQYENAWLFPRNCWENSSEIRLIVGRIFRSVESVRKIIENSMLARTTRSNGKLIENG